MTFRTKKELTVVRTYIELQNASFYDPVNFNSWICEATSDVEIWYAHFVALARPQKFGKGMRLIQDGEPTLGHQGSTIPVLLESQDNWLR